ncbi:MAG: hypothetical protein NTW33_01880 [Methanoregula sp.]|nr:hypothetical protein [Methanoregula sp.]
MNAGNIPEPLAGSKRWVSFRIIPQPDGSIKKIPLKITGELARADHPEDWATLPEVLKVIAFGIGQYPAIALGFDFPLRVLDLDRCIDDEGNLSQLARDILSLAGDTYIEKSVSGRGLHVLVWKSGHNFPAHPTPGLEIYDGAPRFIVMTGDLWGHA